MQNTIFRGINIFDRERKMEFKDVNLSNEEALQDFLLDIDCLNELQPWTGHFNLFDVLKISKTEIRHSNM